MEFIERPQSQRPLPPEAKKVFQGVIFAIYQWEQEEFDGSKKTYEKVVRPDSVVIIPLTEDGKIILTREEQPGRTSFLGAPAGMVEEGEDLEVAAARELLEETGYQAKEFSLFHAYQPYNKIEWAIYTFLARGCHPVADQKLDTGEKISLKIVDFEEFTRIATEDNSFRDQGLKMLLLEALLDRSKIAALRKKFMPK